MTEAEAKEKGQEITENIYILGTTSDSAWLSVTWEGEGGGLEWQCFSVARVPCRVGI